MFIFKEKKALRNFLDSNAVAGTSFGFIPTMGALHEGHLALLEQSAARHTQSIVSIFVNPTQFTHPEDLEKYPRLAESDIELLERSGCTAVFMPAVEEMYPEGTAGGSAPALGRLGDQLEGASRPGHFEGVVQVVDLFLDLINPDELFVGQKDYQQCLVLNKLLEARYPHVQLTIVPTLREPDGLAMSSRNLRLTEPQRAVAGLIYQCLVSVQTKKGVQAFTIVQKECREILERKGFRPDYIVLADAHTLELLDDYLSDRKMVALIAASLGDVRLIDNMLI